MCGIAGFSLSANSTINPRQLSNALLCSIEDRGYMASGFAWQDGDTIGWHKDAVTGSQLSLKSMPKRVKNVILHTRLATHGSVNDNRNNHPVLSPSNEIALVHNGVIYNHERVRKQLTGVLPEVDTSVIPAVIEQRGLESIDLLDGDAAIAWFNRSEADTLHVARYQYSPLVIAQVEDGSFIFASTEQLLWRALIQLDIAPEWMHTARELEYYTVRNGIITDVQMLPEPQDTGSRYDWTYYRHQTAGAKSSSKVYQYSYDDDEYWDTPKPASEADFRDDEDDELPEDVISDWAAYYTTVYDEIADERFTSFYGSNEAKLWQDELFILASEDYLTLLDFGKVVDGELVSQDYYGGEVW